MSAFSPFGNDLFGEPIRQIQAPLASRFGVPPFSVLDARSGEWQDRKRAWLALGIESELGRSDGLTFSGAAREFDHYRVKNGARSATDEAGTSVFDPLLCELVYRWFCPERGMVLDPFAGGSVRGVVAAMLGREYTGVDLSEKQIAANRLQGDNLCRNHRPNWIAGDSRAIGSVTQNVEADLLFSCPPYADLEVYSDHPADLSNMPFARFLDAYYEIVDLAARQLRHDRFACFVIGDVRDERGVYRNLLGETIAAFRHAGLNLYNEAILIPPVASLSMRTEKQFTASRKLGKAHQNVLVFVKGDWRKAVAAITAQAPLFADGAA